MTDKDKAKELLDKDIGTKNMSNGGFWLYKLQRHYIHLLCKMAKWKEQQMIDKTIAFMKKHAHDYKFMGDSCIEDYKKEMEEQL